MPAQLSRAAGASPGGAPRRLGGVVGGGAPAPPPRPPHRRDTSPAAGRSAARKPAGAAVAAQTWGGLHAVAALPTRHQAASRCGSPGSHRRAAGASPVRGRPRRAGSPAATKATVPVAVRRARGGTHGGCVPIAVDVDVDARGDDAAGGITAPPAPPRTAPRGERRAGRPPARDESEASAAPPPPNVNTMRGGTAVADAGGATRPTHVPVPPLAVAEGAEATGGGVVAAHAAAARISRGQLSLHTAVPASPSVDSRSLCSARSIVGEDDAAVPCTPLAAIAATEARRGDVSGTTPAPLLVSAAAVVAVAALAAAAAPRLPARADKRPPRTPPRDVPGVQPADHDGAAAVATTPPPPITRHGAALDGLVVRRHACLGAGTYGFVCKGTLEDVPVAVKMIAYADVPDSTPAALAAMARNEAAVHASIRPHPNVVALYGAVVTATDATMAMELCDATTLEMEIAARRRGATWGVRLGWVRDVAWGMAHVHEHGVVHRDLKPANIVFGAAQRQQGKGGGDAGGWNNEDPTLYGGAPHSSRVAQPPHRGGRGGCGAKVADFGLAVVAGVVCGEVAGTAGYVAPEAVAVARAGEPVVAGYARDVYALGVILLEVATGCELDPCPPWVRTSEDLERLPTQLAAGITRAGVPLSARGALPGRLAPIIDACLALIPAARPSMRELAILLNGECNAAYAAEVFEAIPAGGGSLWVAEEGVPAP